MTDTIGEMEALRQANEALERRTAFLEAELGAIQRRESELRTREETFRVLIEASQDPILLMADDRFVECNIATLESLGITEKSRFINSTPADISPERQPDGRLSSEAAADYVGRAHRQGFIRFEWMHQRYDGRPLLVEVALTPILLHGEKRLHVTWRDITERKRSEAALRRSEQQAWAILEQQHQFAAALTPSGTLLRVNKLALEFIGANASDVVGKPFWETPWWNHSQEEQERLKTALSEASQGRISSFETTHVNVHGELHIIDFTVRPFLDDQGEVLLLIPEGHVVTERKRAEAALQESEERYRRFIRHSSEGIYRIDLLPPVPLDADDETIRTAINERAIVVEVNDALAAMYDVTADSIAGTKATQFAPDYAARVLDALKEEDRRVSQLETHDFDKAGNDVFLMESFSCEVDGNRLVRVWGVQRDVTGRKRAEIALRESEERFRMLFECANDAIELMNREYVVECNKRALELYGFEDPEELIGHSVLAFCDAKQPDGRDSAELAYAMIEAALAGSPQRFFWTHGKKDGSLIDVEVSLNAIRMNNQPFLQAIIRDVTERKKAEASLRESEQNYREIFNATSECIIIHDTDTGTMIEVNDRAVEFYGYSREEFQTLTVGDISEGRPPYSNADALRWIRSAIEEGPKATEWLAKRKSGECVWVEVSLRKTKIGGRDRVLVVVRDISERKKAADLMRLIYSSLNCSRDGVTWVGNDARLFHVNDAVCEILGYAREELLSMTVHDIDPDFPPSAWHPHLEELERAGSITFESRHRTKSGNLIPVEITGNYIEFEGQRGSFALVRYIAERKQVEEALRMAEFSIEHSGLPTIWFGSESNVVRVNEATCKSLGYTRDQLLQMTVRDFDPDFQSPKKWRDIWATIKLVSTNMVIETRHRRSDGYIFPVEVVSSYFEYGGIGYVYSFARDISDRKQAEEALRKSEANYRALTENSPDTIMRFDLSLRHIYVNPMVEYQSGIPREAFIGKTHRELDFPEHLVVLWEATLSEVLRSGQVQRIEFQLPHGMWIDWFCIPEFDVDGKVQGIITSARDITVRKRAEEALRVTQFSVDRASDSILWLDEDACLLYVNDASCRSLGYSRNELLSMSVYDIDVDFTPPVWRMRVEEMRQYGSIAFESRHRTKDNRVFPVEITCNYFEHNGKAYIFSFDRDITERKRIEEELRESEVQFRSVVEASPIAIGFDSNDGRTEYFNPKMRETFGYTVEEIPTLEDWFLSLYPDPDYRKQVQMRWQSSVETAKQEGRPGDPMEVEITCRDGSVRTVEVFGAPMGNRNLVMFTDVTERKRAEEELRKSEERFRGLIESVPAIAIQGYRLDGTTTYWNKASENFYGYTQEEAIGRNLLDLIIPPEMHDAVERSMKWMTKTGLPIPSDELSLMRKDGSRISVFSNHALVFLPGTPRELFCFDIDLTERKRAEEDRDRLQMQLTHAQRMESVGRLAGGVAHDFNNMLGVILGHTEIALERVEPDDSLYTDLEEIQKAGRRSADLTRQLLAFARKQTVVPKILDLNETVEGMLKLLRRLIGEDIDLSWKPKEDLWPVKMDPAQLDQILANLCVNARDAISGVGKVVIEMENASFDEDYCAQYTGFIPGEYVLLAVSDDGCGMDTGTISHIFEPFFTTKEIGKGTGLGLATVYGAVKQNNGFISVYSEPGHGTTFRIYLPRHAFRAEEKLGERKPQAVYRGSETVLLVEDEPAILRMTKTLLEKLGYTVIAASTPGEALRLAQEHLDRLDLLMTDVVMPDMNGRDLADSLITICPHIKCLFMSGYTDDTIAHHGVLDEDVHFIQKPFSMKDLGAKIREALENG